MNNSAYSASLLPDSRNVLGIPATFIDIESLPKILIPEAKGDKIPTLNKTGFMKTELDVFSQKFIHFTLTSKKPVLEIGAAYGIATLQALKNNVTIIANDIEEKHLIALLQKTPKSQLKNLYIKPGHFPANLEFEENSLGAVLICRVAHFFTGEEMDEGFKKIYKWLAPKGKIFFISMSPYHHLLKDFLPTYIRRAERGEKWPGVIENMKEYNPKESADIPNFLHVFDDAYMRTTLEKMGFNIEEITLFDYSNNSSDQKGYLGFIAVKP